MATDISQRSQVLLRGLIQHYIEDGQPVGSRVLAQDCGLKLSPATVRNVMADLEDLGLIYSPHTSAGRVPTVKGYRFFVDSLIAVQPLDSASVSHMANQMVGKQGSRKAILTSASTLISGLTNFAGIVTMPLRQKQVFRQVEFLPLSGKRVLVILVVNQSEVENRVITTQRQFSMSELQQMANYLNELFSGGELAQVRKNMLKDLQKTRKHMNRMMREAIEVAGQALSVQHDDEGYVISGQSNLMGLQELSSADTLRGLFMAFNQQREMLEMLDQCMNAEGIQIFIGEESGNKEMVECSMITKTYQADGETMGVLGVIGPKRMNYEKVIPIIDVTSSLLSASLKFQS